MNKFTAFMDFIGSLEPSKWVSSSGIKVVPYMTFLFCGYVLLHDGIKRGLLSLLRYVVLIALAASVISTMF